MTLDDFLPLLLPDVPGCPDATAKRALVDAAIDLCAETKVWNEIQDPFTLIDRQHTYEVEVPAGARLESVMSMWGPHGPVLPKTMEQIDELVPGWQAATSTLPVYFNAAAARGSVRVFPTPELAQRARLSMRVAYKPAITATELDDMLANDYHEALCHGALARLMLQPGKAWSSAPLGAFHGERFGALKLDARIAMLKELTPATLVVKARPFGF